jgi:hypothetical protein
MRTVAWYLFLAGMFLIFNMINNGQFTVAFGLIALSGAIFGTDGVWNSGN